MTQRPLIAMGWSGGKDSALALYQLQLSQQFDIAALLTTVTEGYERISMHGVRVSLLQQQADSLRLPLRKVAIPQQSSNAIYEERMAQALNNLKARGVSHIAFGDLFLQDIRSYRERQLAPLGLQAVFPIWGWNTAACARAFIALGFKARLVCVDPRSLAPSFAGREFDASIVADLPTSVDPCGENGEFHTFVYDGPNFTHRVEHRLGDTVIRDGFAFCDLTPAKGFSHDEMRAMQ